MNVHVSREPDGSSAEPVKHETEVYTEDYSWWHLRSDDHVDVVITPQIGSCGTAEDWKPRSGQNRIDYLMSGFASFDSGGVSGDFDSSEEAVDIGVTYGKQGDVFLNPCYETDETHLGIGLNLKPDLARELASELKAAAHAAEQVKR